MRALVALWNGAVWRTLGNRALPPESDLAALALFPGGAWAVGEKGMAEHGRVFFPLMVRVTGTTVRQVPVPRTDYGSALEDVAATSAAYAWAVGLTLRGPLILHWNGTAWTRVRLPATVARGVRSVDAVAATSRPNAWAVIRFRTGSLPRLMHCNGRRWGDVVTPDIGRRYGLGSVAATSANNVRAVGGGVILHWNGRKWTCALSPDNLDAVATSSADNACAVGLFRLWHLGRGAALERTHLEAGHDPPGPVNSLDGVAVIPQSGGAWAVGGTGHGTLMLHWNG